MSRTPKTNTPDPLTLASHALSGSSVGGVGRPGRSAHLTVISSVLARSGRSPASNDRLAPTGSSVRSTSWRGTEMASFSAGGLGSSAWACSIRRPGMAARSWAQTAAETASGIQSRWTICSSRPLTSAITSLAALSPERATNARLTAAASVARGKVRTKGRREARIKRACRASAATMPPNSADPPMAAVTAGISSVFTINAFLSSPLSIYGRPAALLLNRSLPSEIEGHGVQLSVDVLPETSFDLDASWQVNTSFRVT
jgi:hypothetical protein